MVNAKFNTDEYLNELLEVDRHMDFHPGGRGWLDAGWYDHLVGDDDGWYDDSDDENDMDEENDSDDSEESWDDPNRRIQIPDKDGEDDQHGTDDDNDLDSEEE